MRYQSTASSYDRTAKAVTYRSDESEGPPTGQRPPTLSLNRAGLDANPGKAHVTMRCCD